MPAAKAQTADDFFNGGAQLYISNNIPLALTNTENGLKLYPNDEKLQKLEKLLKQQQQSQSQSQQNQQKQQQQNQQNQSSDQKNQQQSQKQNPQKPEDQTAQKQNAQNADAEKMTPEEAKHLLDSQKEDEQVLTWKPPKPQQNNQPSKDW
jgi:Ca-activated chloride channel family protein